MTTLSLVKRVLFFFYLFLVLSKTYADPISKKSTYSFTSGSTQNKVEFTEQRTGKIVKYTASTITTGAVLAEGEIANVEGVFTVTTEISEEVPERNRPRVNIRSFDPPSVSSVIAQNSMADSEQSNLQSLVAEIHEDLPNENEPLHSSTTPTRWYSLPVLNRELIDNLPRSGTTQYQRIRSADCYTLPLGAFRVNDLTVFPQLTTPVVTDRSDDIVQIEAGIEFSFIPFSIPNVRSSPSDLYLPYCNTINVSIDIRLTDDDALRVETIRTTDSESGVHTLRGDTIRTSESESVCPNFILSFLSESQEESPQPAPELSESSDSVRAETIRTISSGSGGSNFNLSSPSENQEEPLQRAPQLLESSVNLLGGAAAHSKSF